ncbi:MAG: CARDB domain-containing protein [Agitococcus sp.]|nr:CARDB domain-containing protein [Agitococcus sp.]
MFLGANVARAAVVDIVVNQSDSPDPIAAGGLLTYTIAVTNNGPDDATGVVLTDTIPVGTTFVSSTTTKGSCAGNPAITCTIGALANGETATVTIRIIPTTIGTLTNTATTTRNEPDSNVANNADTDVTTVQVGTDLSVTKTDSADPVSQGGTFNYVLTGRNNGPYALGASDTLTISDNIPTGIRVTAIPTGTGWSCSPSSGYPMNGPFTLTCNRTGALAISTNAPSVTIPVTALSLGTITNQVTLSSSVEDDNTANNTATQSTTVNQAADVAISKSVSQASNLGLGQDYSYSLIPTLIVGTTGTITVSDNFPAGAQLTATPTGSGWTCTPSSGFPIAGPVAISCTSATTATNSSLTPLSLNNITVNFKPTATGGLSNQATINPGVTDINIANNTSNTVINTVINDVGITKSVSQVGNIGQNRPYTYTLAPVLTMGTTGATITVTDNVPAGITITSAPTGSGWSCSPSSGFPLVGPVAISCTRASAGNATTTPLSLNNISFNFTPTATGIISNTASINSGATDTNATNDSNTVTNTVLNDLSVTKTLSTTGLLGQNSNYTYTLASSIVMGDSGGVITLTDVVPTGARFNSITGATYNIATGYTVGAWTCVINGLPGLTFPVIGNGVNQVTCTRASATNNGPGASSFPNVVFGFTAIGALGSTVTNTATVSSPAIDTNPANNSNSVVRTIAAPGDSILTMNKIATNTSNVEITTSTVGTPFRYALTVRNTGPITKPNGQIVTVEDIVPVGITLTAINSANNWTCTVTNPPTNAFPVSGDGANKMTCTRTGALNVGSTYDVIRFDAVSTTGGLVTNTGSVTAAFGNVSESADVTFSSAFDLTLAKSDTAGGYGPSPMAVGDTVDYRLRVSNAGPNSVAGGVEISVADTIPAGTTYISAVGVTPAHNWVCPAGPIVGSATITCTRTVTGISGNTLTNGGSSDIRFTLRADVLANITNNATVAVTAGQSETNALNNNASDTTIVRPSADLAITKTASVPSLYAGENLTYTVTVTNNGTNATGANNVSVTDDMRTNPSGTFVSVVPAQAGWICNNSINLVCDYNNSLLSGQSVSFDVTIKPNVASSPVGSPRNNTATVVFRRNNATDPVDPNPANNSATVGVIVLDSVDLFVTKTDAPDPVRAGTDLTYVITVANAGPGTATTVAMVDSLPADIILRSILPSGSGSCTTSPATTTYTTAASTVSPPSAFSSFTCTWPSLAATSQQTVTVIGRPTSAAALAGSISNTVSVSHANSASVPDINLTNNTDTEATVVTQAQIDLLVNKVDTPDPVARFTNMTYTVTVQNQGPSVATNVVVTENLPHTHLTYISVTSSQGSCGVPVANVMTCNVGNLEVGANAVITITMTADTLGTDTNTVSVTATEFDTNLANNSVSENTTVQLGADLLFSKLATPDPVIAGNAVFYFLKVKNTGPANASNVTITDTFPTGISYQSYVASQGTCSHVTGVVTCNLGPLPYNATAQVTLTAVAMVGGLQLNSATVTSTTPDPNPADNTDTAPVTVVDGIVRGRVFADNGLGGGTANNGLQNGGELGIGNVIVKLTDCGTTDYVFAQTDGLGDYQLIVPALLATGAVLCVVETNLSGYRNTGGSAGTTAGTYSITTDKTQFTYTDGVTYTGVNFADVAESQLFTDGNQQSEPNTTVNYAHTFIAGSDGKVSFSTSAVATPSSLFWSNVLYRDSNCDGILDAGEPVIAGLYSVQAGDVICLINKQFVPSNATQGALNVVSVSSSFVYDTLAPTVTEVLTRTDTTTVGLTNTLVLQKSVDKLSASPGETVTYTITYRNNGTQAISNIVINDSVPAFTHSPVASCLLPLPANISVCTPVITSPLIQWNLTGTLAPSQQGNVRFQITLDN